MNLLQRIRRIFAYNCPVDMRKGFLGLEGLVRIALDKDPLSGDIFVFTNRAGTHLKCLFWDRTGFVIKRYIEKIIMLTLEEARALCPDIARMEQGYQRRLEEQQGRIDWLERQYWGASSEKRAKEILNLGHQLWLGQELMPVPVDPPARTTTVKEYERKQRKNAVEVVVA